MDLEYPVMPLMRAGSVPAASGLTSGEIGLTLYRLPISRIPCPLDADLVADGIAVRVCKGRDS
jgi:hypothetical protein